MTSPNYSQDVFEYALLMKSLHADFADPHTLAGQLMELRTGHNRKALKLPLYCTAASMHICELLDQLPELNELLYLVGAEVVEVIYGKLALRLYEDTEDVCHFRAREVVAVFLHCVLTRHRCVDSLQFVLSPRGYHGVNLLLCDALCRTTSVTCLHLKCSTFNTESAAKVIGAISRLLREQLIELSLESLLFRGSFHASLQDFLASLSNTRTLKTQAGSLVFVQATMDALARTPSLFSLVVDASVGILRLNEQLLRMLANPFAPVQLTVIAHKYNLSPALAMVLSLLRQNSTVTTVTFKGFHITSTHMRFASDLLAANGIIQEICFTDSTWDIKQDPSQSVLTPREDRWHATALVELLASTVHLRRLTVPFDFIASEVLSILQAAQRCQSLQELQFPVLHMRGVVALYSVLNDMSLVEKLRIGKFSVTADTDASTVVARLQYVFSGPRGLNSPELLFGLRGDSPWLVGGHCGGHVTNLLVTDYSGQALLHPDIARCLGDYLPLTRSLKTFSITVPMLQESAKAIIHGLASNGSIEELIMRKLFVLHEDVTRLSTWLSRSQMVHSVEVFFEPFTMESFLQTLAEYMEYNYTLTSLSVGYPPLKSAHGLLVKNITRRNFGLVQCAASYALGCSTRRAEAAFRMAAWHPQLLSAVQKMGLMDEKEAKARIRKAWQSSAR
ncbi:uncharacterized protein [Dermacentor albipictus]|uniref:uncharacterized protein isoform X2 n=1 Tax=Dermacentor albipictus TaxID=60249 RepID=UPI0038FCFCBA